LGLRNRIITDAKSWLWLTAVLAVGGLAGFFYYRYFGCRRACPLSSNPYLMIGLGSLLALNIGVGLILKPKGKNGQNGRSHKEETEWPI